MHFHLTLIRPFQIPPYLSIMLLTDDKPQEYSSRKLKSHNVTWWWGNVFTSWNFWLKEILVVAKHSFWQVNCCGEELISCTYFFVKHSRFPLIPLCHGKQVLGIFDYSRRFSLHLYMMPIFTSNTYKYSALKAMPNWILQFTSANDLYNSPIDNINAPILHWTIF